MADVMNNVIDQVTEAAVDAGTSMIEPVAEATKKFHVKEFIGGTVVGAAGAVVVSAVVKAAKDSKDEIKAETDKVKAEKFRKKIEKCQEKLEQLSMADQDEEEFVEDLEETGE